MHASFPSLFSPTRGHRSLVGSPRLQLSPMWRSASSASRFLLRSLVASSLEHTRLLPAKRPIQPFAALLSSSAAPSPSADAGGGTSAEDPITLAEAKRLMRLVNVEALKRKLGQDGEEMIGYARLLDACERLGVARSREEAAAFARVLDEAGVVLLFRDKVCLHPDKVVDLVRRAVPFALTTENDPRREELQQLQKKKEELDALAHKQVRRILWSGLGFLIFQISIFFRLTFWEFSWDVMEPITFFATTAGLLAGYAYFLFTSRDPTYQDLMMSLVLSRQRKLYKKHQFNLARYNELQKHCKNPLDRIVVKYNEQKLVSSRSD